MGKSGKNIHYFSGWKSNNAYKVNKKVIIPFYYDRYSFTKQLGTSESSFINDVEKTIKYFTGDFEQNGSMLKIINNHLENDIRRNIDTKYFIVSIYKKGTIHLTFKDTDILRRFNLEACKNKNFIPHDYSTKPFEELNYEEKKLVNEFETEKEYTVIKERFELDNNVLSIEY